jgi:transcription antitermination factor NusG
VLELGPQQTVVRPVAASLPALPQWFAVHTRSRHEKQVARLLAEKRLESFLPLHREVHRWKDRYKPVELPLFNGYVFVQLAADTEQRLHVLKTFGVVRIVGFGRSDTPVPEKQIEMLRRLTASDATLHRHRYLRVGQRVRVISGTLAGMEGILMRMKKSDRLVVSIPAIRQAVAVELSGYEVLPVG